MMEHGLVPNKATKKGSFNEQPQKSPKDFNKNAMGFMAPYLFIDKQCYGKPKKKSASVMEFGRPMELK